MNSGDGSASAADRPAIALFDGVCGLCNRTVRFARTRMKPGRLAFESLQSDRGQELMRQCGLDTDQLDTFVLVEGDRHAVRSTAALRLMKHLRFPWPVLSAALIIPRPVRDAVYRFVARRRYMWFGTCELPANSEREPTTKNAGANERTGD